MYVVRHTDARDAVEPGRNLVKLVDPNLWKPACPEGPAGWRPGTEIRSEAVGVSLFRTGTREEIHHHEGIWEIYQVLEGRLRVAVKPHRRADWTDVTLAVHDMLLLPPGTLHLADAGSRHLTQVIQAPPALSDKQTVGPDHEDFPTHLRAIAALWNVDAHTLEQRLTPTP